MTPATQFGTQHVIRTVFENIEPDGDLQARHSVLLDPQLGDKKCVLNIIRPQRNLDRTSGRNVQFVDAINVIRLRLWLERLPKRRVSNSPLKLPRGHLGNRFGLDHVTVLVLDRPFDTELRPHIELIEGDE